MPFLTQGKTNWRYILILLVLSVLVGSGALYCFQPPGIRFSEIKLPSKTKQEKEKIADWKTYTDKENGFEIKYPINLILNEGKEAAYPSGALFPPAYFIGEAKVRFAFPKDEFLASRNGKVRHDFSAFISIHKKKNDLSGCFSSSMNNKSLTEKEKFNNIVFYKDFWREGGAGYRYDGISYRTIHKGVCYEINLVTYWFTHFLTKEEILSYQERALKVFNQMLPTFRFLD
mgnify:CR=1 FL=1